MDGYSLYICLGILAQILLPRSSPPPLRVSYKKKIHVTSIVAGFSLRKQKAVEIL